MRNRTSGSAVRCSSNQRGVEPERQRQSAHRACARARSSPRGTRARPPEARGPGRGTGWRRAAACPPAPAGGRGRARRRGRGPPCDRDVPTSARPRTGTSRATPCHRGPWRSRPSPPRRARRSRERLGPDDPGAPRSRRGRSHRRTRARGTPGRGRVATAVVSPVPWTSGATSITGSCCTPAG